MCRKNHIQEMFDYYKHNSENWKDRNIHRGMVKLMMEYYITVKKKELHLYVLLGKFSMKSLSEKASFSLILLYVCIHLYKA